MELRSPNLVEPDDGDDLLSPSTLGLCTLHPKHHHNGRQFIKNLLFQVKQKFIHSKRWWLACVVDHDAEKQTALDSLDSTWRQRFDSQAAMFAGQLTEKQTALDSLDSTWRQRFDSQAAMFAGQLAEKQTALDSLDSTWRQRFDSQAATLAGQLTEKQAALDAISDTSSPNRVGRPICWTHKKLKCFRKKRLEKDRKAAPRRSAESISQSDVDAEARANTLVSLIRDCGLYLSNGTLSLHTGVHLMELRTSCLISAAKLPAVLYNVLCMLFGSDVLKKVPPNALLNPSFQTLDRCANQSSIVLQKMNADVLRSNDLSDANRIIGICLSFDDANKGAHAIKGKLGNSMDASGVIRRCSFSTDISVTKKPGQSADATFSSLSKDLGNGIYKIICVTCDWVHEGKEAKTIGKLIDDALESLLPHQVPQSLKVPSKICASLVYDFSGRIRSEDFVRPCQAHYSETISRSFNLEFGQECGLNKTASTRQKLYQLFHCEAAYDDLYTGAIVQLFCAGDSARLMEVPPKLLRRFRKIADVRWLSTEQQAKEFLELIQIRAPQEVVDHLVAQFGHPIMNDILESCQIPFKPATDEDVSIPSALMLIFYYLSTTASKGSDRAKNFLELLAFSQSRAHLAALCILAAMFPLHAEWLAFSNGKSRLSDTSIISTRLLENSVYCRKVLQSLSSIAYDWKAALPDLLQQILVLTKGSPSDFEHWDSKLKGKAGEQLTKSLKYLRDMPVQLGFSLANLTDPCLAPYIAQGWLRGLSDLHVIGPSPYTSSWESLTSTTDGTSNLSARPTNRCWTVGDAGLAYPGMTFEQLSNAVRESITSGGLAKARGQAGKFGIYHDRVRGELEDIAQGKLKSGLIALCSWKVGDPVASYWSFFKQLFPHLAESLFISFGAVSLTTTAVEASFSMASHLVEKSMSSATVNDGLYYQIQVRSNVVNDTNSVVHHKDGTVSKQLDVFSTSEGRQDYADKLRAVIAQVEEYAVSQEQISSRALGELRGKNVDRKEKQPRVEAEIAESFRKRQKIGVLEAKDIVSHRDLLDEAKLQGKVSLPECPDEANQKRINRVLKIDCIKLLQKFQYSSQSDRELNALNYLVIKSMMLQLLRLHPDALEKDESGRFVHLLNANSPV